MSSYHRRINVAAQLAASLFREADEWAEKGHPENAQKALDAARAQLELAGLESREAAETKASERVAFTADEEAQRDKDAADAAERAAALAAAQDVRDALTDKLRAGTATNTEIQQTLATLLGGGGTPTTR